MTEEMIEIANKMFDLAEKYKDLYYEFNKSNSKQEPIVFIEHKETGESIFMSDDSFNSVVLKQCL